MTSKTRPTIFKVRGRVPIEILSGKRHITWVLAVLVFAAEFQMEPLAPNATSYDTRPANN